MSCYVCRKVIHGYEHFNQVRLVAACPIPLPETNALNQAPPYNQPADNNKCPLWDQVEQRHVNEVRIYQSTLNFSLTSLLYVASSGDSGASKSH